MAKQSKWFVVATEGATTDGRTINRTWIEQMAANYDPKKYGARINLEHIKFRYLWNNEPHSKCYGDVIALKTEENTEGKLQLLAQIDPTEELIKLNKARQKIYTSIECDTNFADTGEAYLVGLAVTDNPASISKEMLKFSAGAVSNPLNSRKEKNDNLFSEAIEAHLEFEEIDEKHTFSVFEKLKSLFANKATNDEQRFSDHQQALELLAEQTKQAQEKLTALETALELSQAQIADIQNERQHIKDQIAEFAALKNQPAATYSARPRIVGDNNQNDGRFF